MLARCRLSPHINMLITCTGFSIINVGHCRLTIRSEHLLSLSTHSRQSFLSFFFLLYSSSVIQCEGEEKKNLFFVSVSDRNEQNILHRFISVYQPITSQIRKSRRLCPHAAIMETSSKCFARSLITHCNVRANPAEDDLQRTYQWQHKMSFEAICPG